MLSYKRISLFIIFCFLFAIMMGLHAHWYHVVSDIELNFTSLPEITCNIPDKKVFTYTAQTDSNGNIITATESWDEKPPIPVVTINAEAHGRGWAHILLYGNIDGKAGGHPSNTEDQKLGSWVGFFPADPSFPDHTISWSFKGVYKDDQKKYSWDGSGSVKLIPWYWHWRISGLMPGGEWKRTETEFHTDETDSGGGSWTVKKNITPIPPNATAPSPPVIKNCDPYDSYGEILLTWTASADDGGTPITDYEYQYCYYNEGYRDEGYWSGWTKWKSAGKDMAEYINVLRAKTKYRVRMRAVNSVGESGATDYVTVTTR